MTGWPGQAADHRLQLVDSSRPSGGSSPIGIQRADHPAIVGEDGLPGQRANQERHEEQRDHQPEWIRFFPYRPGLERDHVGQGNASSTTPCRTTRNPERAQDLSLYVLSALA